MNIKSSYNNYNFTAISTYIKDFINQDFSNINDSEDLRDLLEDYLDDFHVQIKDESEDFMGPNQWNNQEIKYSYANDYGEIVVVCNLDEVFEFVKEGYTIALGEYLKKLSSAIIHELTHIQQFDSYRDRNHYDDLDNDWNYLSNKDELSARVFGGLNDLLDTGYTKETILKKLNSKEQIEDLFLESDNLYTLSEYFSDEPKIWNYILKLFYSAVQNI